MKKSIFRKFLFCLCMVMSSLGVYAQEQSHTVKGTVTDEGGKALERVSVLVSGTSTSTLTNASGGFTVQLPPGKDVLEFTYVGAAKKIVKVEGDTLHVVMTFEDKKLDEIVVIGYGTKTKKDMTGSAVSISSKEFNPGLVGSSEQLISGKSSGVQIMTNGGSPTAGSTIRIRGGASLSASNAPLIVLDGVPLETGGISGNSSNFLSMINPNDIESITVLKDAASTAIYGSRASNGVMMITTKKGKGDQLKINFSTVVTLQQRKNVADMMSPAQFRSVINAEGTDAQKALLGGANTDWQKEVFKNAMGTDNNLGVTGRIAKALPFRASMGYYNQHGNLQTDKTQRFTGSLVLTPSFFDKHLNLTLNLKGAANNNRFANTDAIWNSVAFNPTQPVYSGKPAFGGFYESLDNSGIPATGANRNPVGLLEQETRKSDVYRSIGNFDVDYRFHFLPDLKAHVTVGYDYSKGEGSLWIPATSANGYNVGGSNNSYSQTLKNKLFTGYLNYSRNINNVHRFDATAGYDYQHWSAKAPAITYYNEKGQLQSTAKATDERHVLLSYYGRVNYTLFSKYMITGTVRRDGTSRFSPENRWGTFPSVAVAWNVIDENFLKYNKVLSNLKLRASYGVTGQQDGIGNYSYMSVYQQGNSYANYRFGDEYLYVYRPSVYVYDLKWETTKAFNYGVDFGFLNNRIAGSVEYYTRKTYDLLANVSVPAGTNFDQTATTNVGNIESHGFEFQLNTTPVSQRDFKLDVNFNATNQYTKVTNITLVKGATTVGTYAGPAVAGRGIQILTPGYQPNMFYVYKQVYDASGKPLEGVYADLNKDGVINEQDLYRYHSPAATWMLGFNTQATYKKWSAGFTMRANIGNYVYNNTKMGLSAWETVQYVDAALNNLHKDYLHTGFKTRQYYSDYYVENASFLRMDNMSVAYNFGKVAKHVNMRVGAIAQNVFTITKYSGQDPEVTNGFESAFYPRPRTYSININLEF